MGSANAVNTGMVQVTCTNGTFTVGWDNSNSFFKDKGNIAALYCDIVQHTGYVSDNLNDVALRYYNGAIPVTLVDTPNATVETQTVASQETPTSPSSTQETGTQVNVPESSTVNPSVESPTSTVDSPTVPVQSETLSTGTSETQTLTSESSTPTILPETTTSTIENPLPTPIPAVEPQPVPVEPAPQPAPQPAPEPVPEPAPIPVEPPIEAPVPEPAPPVPEEQPPADAPSEPPIAEDNNEIPLPPAPEEQPAPTPMPLPQPVVKPEPTSQPDTAPEPPIVNVNDVDLTSLPPDTPVQLDNGVVVTAEVAIQVALLQDPGELLSELFTNPAAAFAALGAVGADMSPEARAKSKKAVVQAVVVGSIITQAAGAAAYRRKP